MYLFTNHPTQPEQKNSHIKGADDLKFNSALNNDLARVKKISHFLDKQIKLPGGFSIGADGLIGLIPGVGDIFGAGVSFWLISIGRKYNISLTKQIRMVINILIDTLLGTIPIVGDIFDFAWKSNVKNANIIYKHLEKSSTRSGH